MTSNNQELTAETYTPIDRDAINGGGPLQTMLIGTRETTPASKDLSPGIPRRVPFRPILTLHGGTHERAPF
jgi:hypothetical protein